MCWRISGCGMAVDSDVIQLIKCYEQCLTISVCVLCQLLQLRPKKVERCNIVHSSSFYVSETKLTKFQFFNHTLTKFY